MTDRVEVWRGWGWRGDGTFGRVEIEAVWPGAFEAPPPVAVAPWPYDCLPVTDSLSREEMPGGWGGAQMMGKGNGDDRESRLRGAMLDWQNGPPAWMDEDPGPDESYVAEVYSDAGKGKGKRSAQQVIIPGSLPFDGWSRVDEADLAKREWLYGRHYIRKFCSVTVGPGGLGKSSLVLAEMIAMVTGRAILGVPVPRKLKVLYFNAEDPREEIIRRVLAICRLHNIDQAELEGQLWIASGRDEEVILAAGLEGEIIEPVFELMDKFAEENAIDVFCFDPLANLTESPETNEVFRRLGKRLSRFADVHNCSVEVVHHTRKLNGREAEVEDSRGGGALVGAVRAARVLNPMTADEAARAGLESHIDFFRIDAAGKNNMARPSPFAEWHQRIGVELSNGDHVAAVARWFWPDAFEGISGGDARRVQLAVAARGEDNPPRESVQAKDWVGHIVAHVLGLELEERADRARVQSLIRSWVRSDVLQVVEIRDTKQARDIKCVMAGSNNPAENPAEVK